MLLVNTNSPKICQDRLGTSIGKVEQKPRVFWPAGICPKWTATKDGYYEATGGGAGNLGAFSGLTVAQAEKACCANAECAGFSYRAGGGFYKRNALAGFTNDAGYSGYYKPNQVRC